MSNKLSVLMTTEGTYPFHQGGVSNWCNILVRKMKNVDFVIFSILMDPFVTQKFELPSSSRLIKMPLWGTEEPSEHLQTPFSDSYLAKQRTHDVVVQDKFIPLFRELVREIISIDKDHHRFADTLHKLYRYFQHYEYKNSYKSELTWTTFKNEILQAADNPANRLQQPDVYGLIQSLGWLYRFFNIINTPIPRTHVTHSSAAAFCSIPCVLSKLEYGTPFLLTEHGVYMREQYLSLSKREYSSFLNTFLIRFIHSIAGLSYTFADQVSPVCNYNTRWEKEMGTDPRKIKVIYNGIDPTVFTPSAASRKRQPTVVSVARIDPIKDVLSMIRSAAQVRESIPDVKYVIYGSVTVPEYYKECLALRKQLDLEEQFIFAGHTTKMAEAYDSGDVIILTSISEAFPYSVIEAMMCEKAVIATDVGGVAEALGDTGILIAPRDTDALAKSIVRLLENPELRESLGEEARERALNLFTENLVLSQHLKSYLTMALKADETDRVAAAQAAVRSVGQKKDSGTAAQLLHFERGLALRELGFLQEAAVQLRQAAAQAPSSHAVPYILMELALTLRQLGDHKTAKQELFKTKALIGLQAVHQSVS